MIGQGAGPVQMDPPTESRPAALGPPRWDTPALDPLGWNPRALSPGLGPAGLEPFRLGLLVCPRPVQTSTRWAQPPSSAHKGHTAPCPRGVPVGTGYGGLEGQGAEELAVPALCVLTEARSCFLRQMVLPLPLHVHSLSSHSFVPEHFQQEAEHRPEPAPAQPSTSGSRSQGSHANPLLCGQGKAEPGAVGWQLWPRVLWPLEEGHE